MTKTPDGRKSYKWTVEFEVSETWVEDGFNLTDERALEMLATDLSFAYRDRELKAKVIKAPKREEILKAQGYRDEKHYAELNPSPSYI